MKKIPFLIILILYLIVMPTTTNAQKLTDYKWKNRIILLMNSESDVFEKQLNLFKNYQNEVAERDLIIFRYSDGRLYNVMNRVTEINPATVPYKKYNGLLLIGKDGGVKLKKEFLVKPEEIFDLIDGMPMRRAEIKNGG